MTGSANARSETGNSPIDGCHVGTLFDGCRLAALHCIAESHRHTSFQGLVPQGWLKGEKCVGRESFSRCNTLQRINRLQSNTSTRSSLNAR